MKSAERLKGIDVFVAAAEAASFSAAADKLHLSSSAVGKAIARLEQRLGKRLFERTTRRLALTDAGAAFHRICVRVLEELDSAEKVLAADLLQPAGRLRIDLPLTFGQRQAVGPILDFARRHPAVKPCLSFTDRFVDVVEEGIDVAVRIGGPGLWPAGLGHRFLGTEQLIFCAAPAYLAGRPAPQTPADLAAHDAVMYGRSDGQPAPWSIGQAGGPVHPQMFEPRLVLGHAEAQLSAVVAGCGIAQMATWLVAGEIRQGRLVEVLRPWAVDGLHLHLVWPRSRQHLPKVQQLVAHLAERLRIRDEAPAGGADGVPDAPGASAPGPGPRVSPGPAASPAGRAPRSAPPPRRRRT